MQIDDIDVCIPMKTLVYLLKDLGFEIFEQSVSDVHFHEMRIMMRGAYRAEVAALEIGSVTRTERSFHCSCHWSVVDLEFT